MINVQQTPRRIALLEGDALAEIDYENKSGKDQVGHIYKGIARDVLNGLAAFIDVGWGEGENVFLSAKEINGALLKSHNLRRGETFPIRKVIQPGQHLTVQVKRGGIGTKNAQGTTKISLPGRYWVFMPKDGRLGVSRRISSIKERAKLKRIAKALKRPEEGLIARTAAAKATEEQLGRDFNFLLGTWKGVEEDAVRAKPPSVLYQGPGFVRAYLRDRLLEDVERILIDDQETYDRVMHFLDYLHLGDYKERVALYTGTEPVFDHFGIEQKIQQSLEPRVSLSCGGNLMIEETEALTAIDVNTGRNVHFRGQEEAIFNTNMAAALEIPKQLRLRKISGIIVVDFVDMQSHEHQRKLLYTLQKELKKDRVSADYVDMTRLGLVEITRKRHGESLADMLHEDE